MGDLAFARPAKPLRKFLVDFRLAPHGGVASSAAAAGKILRVTHGYEPRPAVGSWRTEANDLLAPVYGWFTEGFATADLKEAKALLDQLA